MPKMWSMQVLYRLSESQVETTSLYEWSDHNRVDVYNETPAIPFLEWKDSIDKVLDGITPLHVVASDDYGGIEGGGYKYGVSQFPANKISNIQNGG